MSTVASPDDLPRNKLSLLDKVQMFLTLLLAREYDDRLSMSPIRQVQVVDTFTNLFFFFTQLWSLPGRS
jgi:hypothetical protein